MEQRYKEIFNSLKERDEIRNKNSRVLIVDGTNTFIRCWSAMPNMNDQGEHVGGVVGTLQSIGVAIRKIDPTRVIVVFDGKDGSYRRRRAFGDYKANREGKNPFRPNRQYEGLVSEDEERASMKKQFVWLNDFLNYLPITTMIYDGIEADDVIAYVSTQLVKEDEESVIMSVDRDFLQLIDENTKVWNPVQKKLIDKEMLEEDWGIPSENFLLYRTLNGDNIDNIPGVSGLGLKTLKTRIPEIMEGKLDYDTLYQLCEERRGKIKIFDNILEAKDRLKLNHELMQLSDPDIPTQLKLKIMDRYGEKIQPVSKLEFMKIMLKYQVTNNFGLNVNDWLNKTFSRLITDK